MHQQPRHPPRVASPASSPQTNPARTNNPRDRPRSSLDITTRRDGLDTNGSETPAPGPSRESIKKLDQIIQNFYYKAAVLILQSRLNLTPAVARNNDGRKLNKWFSIDTDDIEEFKEELRVYRTCSAFDNPPPPMIIETYIDASSISSSQSLVLIDENGKRWDVLEALNSSETPDDSPRRRRGQRRSAEVVLERWRVELRCLPNIDRDEFGPSLPAIYKRAIVYFRALFMMTRMMPCWKYSQQALAKGIHPALEVKCRILTTEPEYTSYDPLRIPLHDGGEPVTEYFFPDLEVPIGRFYSSVTYRNDVNFRVDDAESLLSSRFMGADDALFKPSITSRRDHAVALDSFAEPGSLPSRNQGRGVPEPQQTYGSLSTFHGPGAYGASPITALRSVRPPGSDTSSPTASTSTSMEQPEPPHSLPIRGATARPSLRTYEPSRRPSVSFQPFKAGSLSGSPRISEGEVPPSPQSYTRPGLSGPSRTGARSSLTAGSAASLRGPPVALPQDVPSVTGSPRPPSRYSSSFGHRRGRPSFGGQSLKGDDDQASSGKQSLSSSAQPGSGFLAELGGVGSSGSFAADDDNISEFLKALESRKTLKSFEPSRAGEATASKRTAAQLSKFILLRDSHAALTDSMASSMYLQRPSTTSSSRQITPVPAMNPSTLSVSSSPGKPVSPHTPHMPAIPSRLSENSIIDYEAEARQTTRHRGTPNIATTEEEEPPSEETSNSETPFATQRDDRSVASPAGTGTATTAAIDIPMSPRLLQVSAAGNRRASSVAHQQHRSLLADLDDFSGARHQRSASVEDASLGRREVPSLSALLAFQRGGERIGADSRPAGEAGEDAQQQAGNSQARSEGAEGSESRDIKSKQRSGVLGRFAGGSSVEGDEEPLLFAMSELERESRRSLEEGRQPSPSNEGQAGSGRDLLTTGGAAPRSGTPAGGREKPYEPRGILRKGW